MRLNSVMEHSFSNVPKVEIQRSSFDRSHGYKTTFNGGLLIPIFVDEALPGDTFNLKMNAFTRLATPIVPVMDNMYLDSFFFAVPYRLLWNNWEKFNGAQDNPEDSTDYLIPQVTIDTGLGAGYETIFDYMGIPPNVDDISVNALPFRAYNLIYNEWFRDQNLQTSVTVPKGDGPDTLSTYALRRRGKRHDYFTSCLPWPQKGESVTIPLGTDAPVTINANGAPTFQFPTVGGSFNLGGGGFSTTNEANWSGDVDPTTRRVASWTNPALTGTADLSDASAATINLLRQGFQIQRMLERDARGGTRYTEIIRSHFGVISPDQRLQRPEYLGGSSTPINFQSIAQTSGTGEYSQTPQGNLSAIATANLQGHGFNKSFTEHCIIIGLVSVRADLTYQQGLNKMWSRRTRYDHYWPSLANLGEQAVLSKEIFLDGTAADDDVFGYQERYAEYRYKPSLITGKFRSSNPNPLDVWHLSQDFTNRPLLNSNFIQENPPIDRIIAVQNEPHFLFDAFFKLRCARPMPLFGVPGLIDHF